MVTQQLLDYIKQQTQIGKNKDEVTAALLEAGWQAADVNQAFINPTAVPAPIATEIPKARQILRESWAIYKNRFKTLIAIILIPTVLYLLLIVLAGLISSVTVAFFQQHSASLPIEIAAVILATIAIVLLIYVYVWSAVAQLFAIKDHTENIGWKEAYTRSKPKINPFFSTNLLLGIILGLIWLLVALILIAPAVIFTLYHLNFSYQIITWPLAMALVVYDIFLALWFSQSPYIVIEEDLKNTVALKKSKYYVKGRIGQIFGKLFYVGIITLGLYIVLSIVLAIIGSIMGIKYTYISWIGNIFTLIWSPLVTVYGYQVYKYCKATRP